MKYIKIIFILLLVILVILLCKRHYIEPLRALHAADVGNLDTYCPPFDWYLTLAKFDVPHTNDTLTKTGYYDASYYYMPIQVNTTLTTECTYLFTINNIVSTASTRLVPRLQNMIQLVNDWRGLLGNPISVTTYVQYDLSSAVNLIYRFNDLYLNSMNDYITAIGKVPPSLVTEQTELWNKTNPSTSIATSIENIKQSIYYLVYPILDGTHQSPNGDIVGSTPTSKNIDYIKDAIMLINKYKTEAATYKTQNDEMKSELTTDISNKWDAYNTINNNITNLPQANNQYITLSSNHYDPNKQTIGATGPVGNIGPIGPIGNTGPTGRDGYYGTQGVNGLSIIGPVGPTGPTGPTGAQGVAGNPR